ncbi:hypothetical protein [Roseivirga misakiensis]|uniref:Uncharacterized protein n=1 Tax=Roseivirga misakiensis TaxID=1563681 RepID=A0A1E5SY79_9BACT|nr:hypothetical protein [Roseivirga misakiensis]OEK04071.1 hypothetical protein BFP71_11305 [Roseivirga misakiensis]
MNSPIVKNNRSPKVKNVSALIAVLLAAVTLLQAGNLKSEDLNSTKMSVMEAQLIAEVEQFYAEEELTLEEEIYLEMEEQVEQVSIFDNENNLVSTGNPAEDNELRKLVNKADYMSEFAGKKYYRLSE